MTCLHYRTSRWEHRGMTWLNYITVLPRINIGVQYMKYIREYISKLQIHQHSLLTRKVFSRHKLLALVFFSVSTGSYHHIHLQVVFIFKSSSSSSHIHLQVIFIFKSSSSSSHLCLQVFFLFKSSSSWDLDHHSIWITTAGSSLLDHHH